MCNTKIATTTISLILAMLLAACGPAGSNDSQNQRTELDRCALLTDEEVLEAIGAHDGGSRGSLDRPNHWGAESCRWTAAASREIDGYGAWSDAIEVAVFDKAREGYYRDRAEGELVQGLGEQALYDESSGDLWFNCGGSRFCAVKSRTASAAGRQELATRLAKIVQKRVQS
jgi:hypothetical protein